MKAPEAKRCRKFFLGNFSSTFSLSLFYRTFVCLRELKNENGNIKMKQFLFWFTNRYFLF